MSITSYNDAGMQKLKDYSIAASKLGLDFDKSIETNTNVLNYILILVSSIALLSIMKSLT